MARPFGVRCFTVALFVFAISVSSSFGAFGSSNDKVLLKDVSVLTLYKDKYTSGRRSSPVPQLTCVGGTGKGYFNPSVVQCYNRGSDGYDIQWECKADMDNAFRFGTVEVTCEGYDYPDDPYILKGSCGLEYTVELTEEGYQQYKQQKSQHYTAGHDNNYGSSQSWDKKGKSIVGDLIFLGGVALVIYIVYKSCISSGNSTENAQQQQQPRADRRPDQPPPYSPPPYGFRQEYMPGGGDSCSGGSTYTDNASYTNAGAGTGTGTGNQGGGFWTGAATGGVLGYLFGRNNNYGGYTQYQQPYNSWGSGTYARPRNTGWFSGWGSGGRSSWGSGFTSGGSGSSSSSWGSGSSGSAFRSSGTRTASGFGGTKRR